MDIIYSPYWLRLQSGMFPMFEETLGAATDAHYRVIATLDMLRPERLFEENRSHLGRKPIDRIRFFRAFIARTVLKIPTAVALIDRLKVDAVLRRICGWEFSKKIPCEGSFSNAFSEFAESKICEKIHEKFVSEKLQNELVFHISRDSTEIVAREAAPPRVEKEPMVKEKRGRPKKGEIRKPATLSRLQLQMKQGLEKMLADLSGNADYGAKRDSQGNNHAWLGYKFHLDIADGGIPVSACLTPASVHDSGVSIPLQIMTNNRCNYLYLLADKAYDAKEIREQISAFGQVSIIPEKMRRNGTCKILEKFEEERFKNRSGVERVNSLLKDNFCGRMIYVKGQAKVMCHLMFGILAITSIAFIRLQ